MGMLVGGKRGIVSEMNVVPLIDILLVLLVISVGIGWATGLRKFSSCARRASRLSVAMERSNLVWWPR